MLTQLCCEQLSKELSRYQSNGGVLTPKGQHGLFYIEAEFEFTWEASADEDGEEETDMDEHGNIMAIRTHNVGLYGEWKPIFFVTAGTPVASLILLSSMGLPKEDRVTIEKEILSHAVCIDKEALPNPSKICLDLSVSCHLESREEVAKMKAATSRFFRKKALRSTSVTQDEAGKCGVCLEDMVAGSRAIKTPCSHVFHHDCITAWLLQWPGCLSAAEHHP